jgi:hypothetical protein
MILLLSIGMLTTLGTTTISQVAPAFADGDDCEDNGDNSCNEQKQKTELDNDCKIINEIENDDRSDENRNGEIINGDIVCSISLFGSDDPVTNEPGDVTICHRAPGNPEQEETMDLTQESADSHLNNHPLDTLGPCPLDEVFGPLP